MAAVPTFVRLFWRWRQGGKSFLSCHPAALRRRREAAALVAAISRRGDRGGAHRAAALPLSSHFARRQRGRQDDASPWLPHGTTAAQRMRLFRVPRFPDSRDSSGTVVDGEVSTLATTLVCQRTGRRVIPRALGRVVLALLHPGLLAGRWDDGDRCRFQVAGARRRWHGRVGEWPSSKFAQRDSAHPRRLVDAVTKGGGPYIQGMGRAVAVKRAAAAARRDRAQRWRRASQVSREGAKKTSCSLLPRPLPSRHTRNGRQDEEGASRAAPGEAEESNPVR